VTVRPAELPNAGALGSLFETLAQNPPDALLVLADVTLLDQRDAIAALGLRYGLPVISGYPEMTHAGALAGYGPPRLEFYRRAATYVKKILDGTRPQDLPVEQPVRIELSVNLKTARSLGITIPEFVLARADEVIE
jgi:putative ABC transport system substrate-binding protein